MASEKAAFRQAISGTEIELEYYRPSVRGRSPIFGGIVTWEEVWTPGANYVTTLRVSKEISLNGVAIPAGKYGLWIQVLEHEPWTLVVHSDTVRGHGNHPPLDDALYRIPLEPGESPDFVETLTFTLDKLRLTGAELQLNWGNVRVPMAIGVDPGIRTTFTPEEASAVAGEWSYDDTPSLPTQEEVDEQLARAAERSPESHDGLREYYDGLFATERPRVIRFEWNRDTGTVSFVDPADEAWIASLTDPEVREQAKAYSQLLLPRGEGLYTLGFAIAGELAEYDPRWAPLLEFELDDAGRPVRFTRRSGEDELEGTGVRPTR